MARAETVHRSIVDRARRKPRWAGLALALLVPLALAASAQAQAVGLGTADSFAVLGGSTVTNTGPSVITGDLGVSPGTAVVGFPPGVVIGAIHVNDAVASQAQTDLTTAYNEAAGAPSTANLTGIDLGFFNAANPLSPGVYTFDTSAGLTGNLTLDAGGDPDAVWIFQIGSTLTTASGSSVTFLDGIGEACNVFWQVGSSATLGSNTDFIGNVLALTSITATTGATVEGSLLARNGAVTLDTNTVNGTDCATPPTPEPDEEGPDVIIDGGPGDGVPGNPTSPPGGGGGGPPGGGEKPCVERDFRLRIRARDESGIRRVEVFLDGRLIKRTTRRRFLVWIRAERLSGGRHKIRVVARDRAGNRTVKRRTFERCERPVLPDFTGRVGHRP